MDVVILAAWGELIGGIAVVGSLVYLAGQIRQNSKLLRASTASISRETNSRLSIPAGSGSRSSEDPLGRPCE